MQVLAIAGAWDHARQTTGSANEATILHQKAMQMRHPKTSRLSGNPLIRCRLCCSSGPYDLGRNAIIEVGAENSEKHEG